LAEFYRYAVLRSERGEYRTVDGEHRRVLGQWRDDEWGQSARYRVEIRGADDNGRTYLGHENHHGDTRDQRDDEQ
jgi:hypothetical protein